VARTSRDEILAALREAAPPDPGLPGPGEQVDPQRWPDLPARLADAVAQVGGKLVRVSDAAGLAREVDALASSLGARRIVSEVPAAGAGNVPLARLADPHELEGTDLAVLPGDFAVAETGAVWLDARQLAHRAVFVVTEHLALVVPAAEIVNDMHEAYARLWSTGEDSPARAFDGTSFGVFVAGPSKTADIEQALVLGAHGARSCTVFLVG
jgi:L-lactate dehydrogenase complex protein LldG